MTKNLKYNSKKGFMLLEMIIYSALFSIMMGGLVIVAFQLSANTSDLALKVTTQEEINFVTKKIDWALTGISKINIPTNSTTHKLSVEKINFNQNPIIIELNQTSGDIEFCTNSCSNTTNFSPLTTKNIQVDDLSFEYINTGVSTPAGIKATVKINGITNTIYKYFKI